MRTVTVILSFVFSAVLCCQCTRQTQTANATNNYTFKPCFAERKTVSTLPPTRGHVMRVGDIWILMPDADHNMRYTPCQLPESFRQEGKKCIFAGEIKETLATERRAGQPLELTSIQNQ